MYQIAAEYIQRRRHWNPHSDCSYPSEFHIHDTSCILASDLNERLKENLV